MDKHNIKCCLSINMAVLEHYPELAEAMVEFGYHRPYPRPMVTPNLRCLVHSEGLGPTSQTFGADYDILSVTYGGAGLLDGSLERFAHPRTD